jgi:hypothetical protein
MWQLQEPPDLHRNPALAGRCPTNNLARSIFENGRRQHERRKEYSGYSDLSIELADH